MFAARFSDVHTDEECRLSGCGRRDLIRNPDLQRPKNQSCESAFAAPSDTLRRIKSDRCGTFVSEQDSSHAKKLGLRCLGDNIKSPKLQFVQNPRKLRHHEKSGLRKNSTKGR